MKRFRKVLPGLALCLVVGACAQDGTAAPSSRPTEGATVTSPPAQPPPSGFEDLPVPTAKPTPDPTATRPGPGATTAPGPTRRPPGLMTLTGTVTAGVEPGCFLLDGYLLVGGTPTVRAGARVTVTGRVQADMMTTCQQGTPFVVETVEPA
ncbi:hypothetical protein GCM10009779_55380 [Polymorphospora rubra]|uniref:Lipoprotein n=1 Tax=Polymorphospora rubra TaxID=338584 RepID=A0A810N3X9_9ACTN|nr:hypothetical protein [Polymorphospora rubra]BCJ66423.1 hypothetical protein Prubr_34440 [Polymorphospora rubra]